MKSNEIGYPLALAYYKRRWVHVLMRYIPNEAQEDKEREKKIAHYKSSEVYQDEFDPIPTRVCKFYEKFDHLVNEILDPELMTKEEVKQLFILGNPSKSLVDKRFCTEEKEEGASECHDSKKNRKLGENRRKVRNVHYLTNSEFEKFFAELKKLSKKSHLGKSVETITSLLWELNKNPGDFYTLQELLFLQVEDVSPETDGVNWIRLYRRRGMHAHIAVLSLPKGLYKEICRQITDESPLVFSNRYGGPLTRKQVNDYLTKAGESAGFIKQKTVTSLSLKPP